MPYGVVEQVGQHLSEQGRVGGQHRPRPDRAHHRDVVTRESRLRDGLTAQRRQVQLLRLDQPSPRVEPRQVEKLGHQAAEPLRLGEGRTQGVEVGRRDAVHDVLQHGLQAGDRRTQLVADVGHQFTPLAIDLGEVGRHGVEGPRQLSHLVAGGRADAQAVAALGDRLRGRGHLAQRPGHAVGEELHHDHREHDGDRDPQVPGHAGVDADLVDDERRDHGEHDHDAELDLDPAEEVERPQLPGSPC